MEKCNTIMEMSTKDNSSSIRSMDKENTTMWMETITMASGRMIVPKDREPA